VGEASLEVAVAQAAADVVGVADQEAVVREVLADSG
jgi:hypothetical protein